MKMRPHAHVPDEILAMVRETANAAATETEAVITAAVWAYCRQSAAYRRSLGAEFWFETGSRLAELRAVRKNRTLKEKAHVLATHIRSAVCRLFARKGRQAA